MKKAYFLLLASTITLLAGCALQTPKVEIQLTGAAPELTGAQELTGNALSGNISGTIIEEKPTLQEITGETISAESDSGFNSGAAILDAKALIQQRATKPKSNGSLNEDDIGLMEQIIQKVQSLGK